MKNENLPAIDPGQHERLCAYVFGELQGAERASFETELERSSALRREHERLTATIGLVQRAVPDDGLSEDVRRELLASARRSRFRVVRGRRLMQLATACVVILAGTFAWRRFAGVGSERSLEVRDSLVARMDAPSAPAASRQAQERPEASVVKSTLDDGEKAELEKLRDLGYGGEDTSLADDSRSAAAPSSSTISKDEQDRLEKLGYAGGDALESSPPATTLAFEKSLPAEQDSFGLAPVGQPAAESSVSSAGLDAGRDQSTFLAKSDDGAGPNKETRKLWENAEELVRNQPGNGVASGFASRRAGMARISKPTPALRFAAGSSIGVVPSVPQGALPARSGAYRGPGDSMPGEKKSAAGERAKQERPGSFGTDQYGNVITTDKDSPPVESGGLGYLVGGDDEENIGLQDSLESHRVPAPTPEQTAAQVEHLLATSRVAPDESPRDMFFRYFGDAPFVPALDEKVSTFAVDVDTASYALARAYLNRGELPPREAVRTEEFVNYFKSDQPAPTDGKPFALGLELAPSLFGGDARTEMLRVTVRGKDVQDFERQPLRLTLVIDNSGSMQEGERLELVKRALALLLRQLGGADSIAVVKFSNTAVLVTPMIPATRRGELESLIGALPIEGGTNVEAGLRLGYEQALQNLGRNTINRVVLCTDGVGNIGETTAKGLLALVKDARAKGIYLNTVGVGMGNHNDAFLEQLADQGDGVCNYVDSDAEAKRVFVDRLASAVQPIARDVKVQVEFDPTRVESWRLLGYENRALRTQDFRNDAIDAGEVNAGHQVSALYELVRRSSDGGPLATVRLRYKPPFAIDAGKEGARAAAEAEQALELERTLSGSAVLPGFASASSGYQRAVLVAQFAEVLRRSVHARRDSLATLLSESRRLDKTLGDPDFSEFVTLLEKANPLLDARAKVETPKVQGLLDELARLRYEQALRARQRVLSVQAGEMVTLPDLEELEKVEKEAAATIERLEGELRQACGLEALSPEERKRLDELGYGGEEEKEDKR